METQQRILKEQVHGDDVAALQTRLHECGYAIAEEERKAGVFGTQTRAAVEEFQLDHHISQTGIVDEETETALARVYHASSYAVSGSVTSTTAGHVLGGLTVELIDRNVGHDPTLGTTTTQLDGSFAFSKIIISPKSLAARNKTKPDLQVRVMGAPGQMVASKVHYNAPAQVKFKITLPPGIKGLLSEFEALTTALKKAYAGKLTDLQDTEDRQDITYLANKTGWDTSAVVSLVTAQKLGESTAGVEPNAESAIESELLYALFRAGVAIGVDCFLASPQSVETIWMQAIAKNVIPSAFAAQLPAALARFKQISAAHSLAARSRKGVSTLSEMLAETLPEPDKQAQFATLYIEHHDAPANLWLEVEKAFGGERSQQLQFDGQLFQFTRNNAPLVKALKFTESAKPLRDLRDLAALGYDSAAKWKPLIAGNVPPGMRGATSDEQQGSYADMLAAQVRVAYPTDVIASQVKRGALPTEGGAQLAEKVHAFLTVHAENFKFGEEPIETYLRRKSITGAPTQVVEHIKRLHRVYQITPDDRSMAALLRHKLDSASAIVRYKPAAFERAFADKLGSAARAKVVHQRATQVYNTVLNTAVTYLVARAQPGVGTTSTKSRTAAMKPSAAAVNPGPGALGLMQPMQAVAADAASTPSATLESLFGSLDYCACDDCGSILSAAAYLVDLMNFVEVPSPASGFANPQSVLFSRRPDLQYLPLTCENTNTALPYIDLINETLEAFVANSLSLSGYQGHDTGDAFTSADLLASPQFVNAAAYGILQNVYFPPPMPFDRSLEQLRQQFAGLGVSLPDLMIALRVNNQLLNGTSNGYLPISYGWNDIMLELLQISWDELNVFTGYDEDIPDIDLGALYGLPSDGTALATLQGMNLQTFTRRLGISYDDIAAILQTRYVNSDAVLIPLLQQLQMPVSNLADLKSGVITPAQFINLLPAGIDATKYGGSGPANYNAIVTWVIGSSATPPASLIYPRIMDIIAIVDPSGADPCSGTSLSLRYTNPDPTANLLSQTDYIRIIHFIRLWQKLAALFGTADNAVGIQQTADVLDALFPTSDLPVDPSNPANDESNFALAADGFAKMLPCMSWVAKIMTLLSLDAQDSLPQLLACWSDIQTTGTNSLYTQLFLTPSQLQQDQLGQTATIAGFFNPDQTIKISINGVSNAHTVALTDTTPGIAQTLTAAINSCTTLDPDSGLPLNVRFSASANGGVITIDVGFNVICSVSPGATETLAPDASAANTPLLQSFNIGGTVTPGDVLTMLVNGAPVSVTTKVGDTVESLLQEFADTFGITTAQDAYSGAALNTAVLASVQSGSLVLTAANVGTPFDLECNVSTVDPGGIDVSAYDPGGTATITLGGVAAAGDTVSITLTPSGVTPVTIVYTAVAADSDPTVFATNLAAFIQSGVASNFSYTAVATSAGNVITMSWISADGFTIDVALSDTANSTVSVAGPSNAGFTMTVLDSIPPIARVIVTLSTQYDGVFNPQYLLQPGDTPTTIAAGVAAAMNASLAANEFPIAISASSQDNVITVFVDVTQYIGSTQLSAVLTLIGSYDTGLLSPACWVGHVNYFSEPPVGEVTTIIDGVSIPHALGDGDYFGGLYGLCASINTCVQIDPVSMMPVNQTVFAFSAPNAPTAAMLVVPLDPRTSFTMQCSNLPASNEVTYSYTAGGPLPASQSITVVEPLTAGVQLITTINGNDITYTVTASDSVTSIAANIVTQINSSTVPDPASGQTLASLFTVTASGAVITITAQQFTTPLVLSSAVILGSIIAGRQQTPFADDGYGNLLKDPTQTVFGYEPLLCAACNLTGADFALIGAALDFDSTTPLTLDNVSALYRFGWLAHTLGISVLEFLELRSCTQLDPFLSLFPGQPPNVVPPAVNFISFVQALEAAGLEPVQALYLMWNDDITGTAAPTEAQIYALAFNLRQDFVAVNAQFAIVSDPDGSIAANLMALVYTASATDFFFGLLNNTVQPTVSYSAPPDQTLLPPAIVSLSAGLLVYDGLRKQLSFAGLLSDAMAATLIAFPVLIDTSDGTINAPAGSETVFTPASMANIQVGSQAWVDTGALGELVTVAAVTATTFTVQTVNAHNGTTTPVTIVDPLIVGIHALAAASDALANPFFAQYPELQPLYAAYQASAASLEEKRTALLANFIPTLRTKRKQEQSLAAITAAVGTDPSFATSLLNDPLVLQSDQDPASAAIVDLAAIENGGLSLPYGVAATTGTTWAGALDVPQDGDYNLSIALSTGSSVTVTIDGAQVAGTEDAGVWTNQAALSLVAGSPASIELVYSAAVDSVELRWQSTGIGWQPVPANYLYPVNLLGALQGTYVRFLKAASLATALSLTANEIAALGQAPDPNIYTTCNVAVPQGQAVFTPLSMDGIAPGLQLMIDSGDAQEIVSVTATTATTFSAPTVWAHNGGTTPFSIRSFTLLGISVPETSGGWLNLLGPLQITKHFTGELPGQYLTPAAQAALSDVLLSLMNFARMKQSLSPGDERLLDVLQDPEATLPNGQTALVSLTGWAIPSINALLTQFFVSIQPSSLGTVENFRRVFDAYALVQKCRISAAALISATTTGPTANTVSALQSALRALYADSDWQTVIQPINDAMRIKQRDALVAYILQQPFAAENNILTANDLFAYFLLDTETQPPVQTSRIRLALSSVQLFIERCVRSLEPLVASSDIDAAQWSWMKRYRIWQANREVFLWPENWLYPELRDDMSPFFTTMMSRLLQSDITDEAASNAYLDYLSSLEEVAKLEPCGIYYVPGTPDADETSYVVARTAGAKRKYYFRQLQYGSWTPWTEVQIECEALPLTPIVWNGRLFLFWLKAVKQQLGPQFASPPTGANNNPFASLTPTATQANAQANIDQQTSGSSITVGGVLCWTEFYNNKWQPTKTSDITRPTNLGQFDPSGANSFEYHRELLSIVPGIFNGIPNDPSVGDELSQSLILVIDPSASAYYLPAPQPGSSGFLMHNTHSRPIRFEDLVLPGAGGSYPIREILSSPISTRSFSQASDYSGKAAAGSMQLSIFDNGDNSPGATITALNILNFRWAPVVTQPPTAATDPAGWTTPFFYEDRRNVYYTKISYDPAAQAATATPLFGLPVDSLHPLPKPPELVVTTPAQTSVATVLHSEG